MRDFFVNSTLKIKKLDGHKGQYLGKSSIEPMNGILGIRKSMSEKENMFVARSYLTGLCEIR
jgi:hypothetical protein